MSQLEIQQEQLRQLQTLHARTCALMTKFIEGYQCPKLAHLIVSQLGQLISYAQSLRITTNQEMYTQLLEHWQTTTNQLLLEQQTRTFH